MLNLFIYTLGFSSLAAEYIYEATESQLSVESEVSDLEKSYSQSLRTVIFIPVLITRI